jgi:hypothetical protein
MASLAFVPENIDLNQSRDSPGGFMYTGPSRSDWNREEERRTSYFLICRNGVLASLVVRYSWRQRTLDKIFKSSKLLIDWRNFCV